jgi:hypothetical protein
MACGGFGKPWVDSGLFLLPANGAKAGSCDGTDRVVIFLVYYCPSIGTKSVMMR